MKQLKSLLNKALSYLPSKLPVGMSEFEEFSNSILALSGKYADEDSLKFAIASMIIHLPAGKGSAPKNFFVRSLRKSAANQVASQVFQDIKARLEAKQQAEKASLQNGQDQKTSGLQNS